MNKNNTIKKYFNQKEKLTLKNPKYKKQVKFLTDFFLSEDLDGKGDIATNTLIKHNKKTTSIIKAKENGVVAGIEETLWLAKSYKLQVTSYKSDGYKIKKGDNIIKITGGIKTILKLERTILNILQRMSGIATQTNKIVKKVSSKILIVPTRKTQWGLLDKKAVVLGGGGTHRLGLYDFIMIKDNHLKKIRNSKFEIRNYFYEIECKTNKQAIDFSKLNPGALLLDNMKPERIKKLVKEIRKINPNIIIEASGGINADNISGYKNCGVDVISLGALTHSVKSLDISMDIL